MSQRETLIRAMGQGLFLRPRDLASLPGGPIQRATLQRLVRDGVAVEDGGGYRLAQIPEPSPLQRIAARYPKGVVCLLTAQRLHGLTDLPDGKGHVAIARTASRRKKEDRDIVLVSWSTQLFYDWGVEEIDVGTPNPMKVTDRWRTVADMFRPEHRQDADEAQKALVAVAESDGEAGLRKVASYAFKLGFGNAVTQKTAIAMALLGGEYGKKP